MEFRSSQAGSNARRYPEPTRQTPARDHDNVNTGAQGGGEAPVRTMQIQKNSDSKFPKSIMTIVVVVVVAVLLLGGWFAWSRMSGDADVKGGQYQAVFLTNGQVYFCKLSKVDNSYVTCNDIFYLQVQQSVQPTDKSKTDQSQVSLAKLGSELHGPEDTMNISRQQVLFWENLKNDSKVVQAIDSYKKQNK
jgi:hypothetical protein